MKRHNILASALLAMTFLGGLTLYSAARPNCRRACLDKFGQVARLCGGDDACVERALQNCTSCRGRCGTVEDTASRPPVIVARWARPAQLTIAAFRAPRPLGKE